MIQWSRRILRLASVTTALLAHGCATPVTAPPVTTPGPPPPAASPIATRPGRPGFVVAVPDASRDGAAGEMATEIARRTGFGLVVAAGSDHGPAGRQAEAYERGVLEAARGPLRFYAEIHGRERPACTGAIEIATVGVDRERALRLRALAELVRDAHLRSQPEIQRLPVLVAPVDAIASAAVVERRDGVLRLPQEALQIELPRCARRDFREAYTAILADFLAQAVLVPAGR